MASSHSMLKKRFTELKIAIGKEVDMRSLPVTSRTQKSTFVKVLKEEQKSTQETFTVLDKRLLYRGEDCELQPPILPVLRLILVTNR